MDLYRPINTRNAIFNFISSATSHQTPKMNVQYREHRRLFDTVMSTWIYLPTKENICSFSVVWGHGNVGRCKLAEFYPWFMENEGNGQRKICFQLILKGKIDTSIIEHFEAAVLFLQISALFASLFIQKISDNLVYDWISKKHLYYGRSKTALRCNIKWFERQKMRVFYFFITFNF